jgi:predicted acetyltransferase
MDDTTIRLRQPDPERLWEWTRPAAAAFGESFTHAELEHDRHQLEPDRLIGAVDGDAWIGTGGAFTFRMTVPGGGEVGAAGIAYIATAPSHRRRGVLRQVMGWLCDQAVDRGEPVAILWASESAIYQRFGYGIATLQSSFDIERRRVRFVRPADPIGRMRMVDRDEAMRLIPPIYEARRRDFPGAVSRNDAKWRHDLLDDQEWMRRDSGPKFMAVLEVDGVVRGYVVYRVKNDWDDRGPNNNVLALEVLGLDHAAERALWEWLFDLDLAGHIRGWRLSVPHPLLLELTEPRRLGLTIREGVFLRLLDMPAALRARSYDAAGSITFELTDAFRPVNAGRWRLEAGDGGGVTVERFEGDPDLTLDTSDLASVYLGAFRLADLARAGRVGECRRGAVAAADRLFAVTTPPWCSTQF